MRSERGLIHTLLIVFAALCLRMTRNFGHLGTFSLVQFGSFPYMQRKREIQVSRQGEQPQAAVVWLITQPKSKDLVRKFGIGLLPALARY